MTDENLKAAVTNAIQKHNEEEAKKNFVVRFLDKIKDWWKWIEGRRSKVGGYRIMTLIEDIGPRHWWLGLIRYNKGDFQPIHKDPLRKGCKGHLKINIELWPAKGSYFITMFPHFQWGPLHIFWAHHNPHEVTPVQEGTRYVLSFSLFTKNFNHVEDDAYIKKCYLHQKALTQKYEGLLRSKLILEQVS